MGLFFLNYDGVIIRVVNLVPFYSIKAYLSYNSGMLSSIFLNNVIGNIMVFVPLGVYLVLFKKDKRIIINMLLIFMASVFIEIVQWIFGVGIADVDDIILNSLGGLVGIIGYKFLLFVFSDYKKVNTLITIIFALGLIFILCYSFMLRIWWF